MCEHTRIYLEIARADEKRWFASTAGLTQTARELDTAAEAAMMLNCYDALLNSLRYILDKAQIDADEKDISLNALSDIRNEARAALAKASP